MWDKISEMRCGITGKDGNKPEREREAVEVGTPKLWAAANSIFLRFFGLSRGSLQREEGIPLFSIDPKGESRDFTK